MRGQVPEVLPGQHSTSGGSSDSAAKAWQANPAAAPSCDAGDDGDAGGEVTEHLTESLRIWLERIRRLAISAYMSGTVLPAGGSGAGRRQPGLPVSPLDGRLSARCQR